VFEAHPQTGELRKAGIRIKLADQPFRILIALLRRPGELVTRDELRQLLWLGDTAGNFEQGLNRAVNKLRTALSDSASTPRFIETLPGYGYRFVGAVEPEPQGKPPAPRIRPWIPLALAAAVLLTAGIGFVVWKLLPPPIPELRWRKLTTDNFTKFPPGLSDGTRIYFLASYGGESFLAQILVKGGQSSRLPITLPGPVCNLQDLSPDGQEILLTAGVVMGRSRTLPLWTLQITDGAARRLDAKSATSAAYSPDGASISFTTESELWVMRRGSTAHRLLELKDSILGSVSWDPTGQLIRFSRQDPVSSRTVAWEVLRDGTQLHPVLPAWQATNHVPIGWALNQGLELFAADGGFWGRRSGWRPLRQPTLFPPG
jgi:DNA-binding winged helix-turn-helix (wHTH) protein